MHDLHVFQSPNVTRDAHEKIAFFAFHAVVVEDSFQQNRVRAKYTTAARAFVKPALRLGLRAPFVARKYLAVFKLPVQLLTVIQLGLLFIAVLSYDIFRLKYFVPRSVRSKRGTRSVKRGHSQSVSPRLWKLR